MKGLKLLVLLGAGVMVSACSGQPDHSDLHRYMEKQMKQQPTTIEPLPVATPYKPYIYSSLAMRSPFDRPVLLTEGEVAGVKVAKPDDSRPKEYLESINIAAIKMVGSIEQGGKIWTYLADGRGGIHQVTVGNYLGKNYGKIVAVKPTKVELVEIMPDGKGGWIERPRTIVLNEKN